MGGRPTEAWRQKRDPCACRTPVHQVPGFPADGQWVPEVWREEPDARVRPLRPLGRLSTLPVSGLLTHTATCPKGTDVVPGRGLSTGTCVSPAKIRKTTQLSPVETSDPQKPKLSEGLPLESPGFGGCFLDNKSCLKE